MDIKSDWAKIRRHFSKSFSSSLHVSIASVDKAGQPTVTPIGSLFLNDDMSGFYFEKFPSLLPVHAEENSKVCVLAVNSNKKMWLSALLQSHFKSYPALKLYGNLGDRRKATESELRALKRRMRFTRILPGHKYLWDEMLFIREINFTSVSGINLGKMTNRSGSGNIR